MPDVNHNHVDDRIEDAAETVFKAASEWSRDARKRAEDIKSEAAKQILHAAEALRREIRESKVDGDALKGVDDVAGHLEKAAVFLKNNTFEGAASAAAKEVKQSTEENPWRNLLIALVIGIIIGLLLRGGKK
jgi:ElaB/YqjD/DUF883 family membrane-anchored ribosome-binding protein